jgi:phosphoglycolate phosphatase
VKPLLNTAGRFSGTHTLNIPPAAATFLGDSTTDIQAAHASDTMSIGYTNKPGKTTELMTAGANTVIYTLTKIIEQLI